MALIYREERFRTPLDMERSIGLWVDRIGQERFPLPPLKLRTPRTFRIFGQFAVLAADAGPGTLEIMGRPPLRIKPGDAFALFPNLPAAYWPDSVWETHWIVWNGPEAHLLQKIGCLIEAHPVFEGLSTAVRAIFAQLEPLMKMQTRSAILERKALILELVSQLDAHREFPGSPSPHGIISSVLRELAHNPLLKVNVDVLARRHHLSPAYFRRLFKMHTGTTLKSFQLAQRINRAKQDLSAGYSLKEVALRLEFTDVFHFMRVFKNITGQTAGRFIRINLSGLSESAPTRKRGAPAGRRRPPA